MLSGPFRKRDEQDSVMTKCSHVFEIEQGKEYTYCPLNGSQTVGGNPFCFVHAPEIDRRERVMSIVQSIRGH